jgi:hypothetical protein
MLKAFSLTVTRKRLLRTFSTTTSSAMLHHLMVGTWTPPGAIFTLQFDDEKLTLKLIKKTEIPHDEPISWITFSVRQLQFLILQKRVKWLILAHGSMIRETYMVQQ